MGAVPGVAGLPSLVAYVRAGDIYVSKDGTARKGKAAAGERGATGEGASVGIAGGETRLTSGGGYSRPRWSPDGKHLAFLKGVQLWTMKADGSAKRRLTTRAAAGPSWSPDGASIAFSSLSCSGGQGVYRISATAPGARPTVLFPKDCRGEALPPEPTATANPARPALPGVAAGGLSDGLSTDDAVAWSPDGTRVAFRGGNCESIYDACLSVGTLATGGEKTVAAYGGGSLQTSGFAVVPSWRGDGLKLAWTAYQQGETPADNQPVHVVEYDTASGAKRTVGGRLDREMSYLDANRGAVTGQYLGGSWVLIVNLATGARTPFRSGSQPSVQPLRK
jgi:TolB protein